ncbi:hypothetical protein GCM10025868_43690 [Angustibacter aerolatus]|uniref:PASTA domain-containing protein n=1 Tax=Angustibacter aerolatus TaxID=1162965 RepID=A0ABQ6JPP9_9ACTN|nr:PASTA domain-containing protein [Angustibacter aerolatus]GMA89119.1 hypothetical protein GCM10025868_43690 [Angustibacter aerolatus]
MPTVTGGSERAAGDALTARNLVVGDVTRRYDERVRKGRVLTQSVAPGTSVRRGTRVDLVVSRGRQPVTVRSTVGKAGDAAVAALRAAGLDPVVSEAFDDEVPDGDVVSQTPAKGTLFKGDRVELVVSKGPPLVTVPRVVGTQAGPAEQALRAAGFDVRVRKVLGGYFGTVRSQSPDPGERAPRGSTVTLTVV